jgi:hypothetical protein
MTEQPSKQKTTRRRRWYQPDSDAGERVCEWDGCEEAGEFRAPKAAHSLRDFQWFCLDHVREYNKGWNYFSGLDETDIESIRRQDSVWHRPSWPLGGGTSGAAFKAAAANGFSDPLGAFDDATAGATRPAAPPSPRDEALAKLDLDRSATPADRKARYKELVKKHHPDANGGCKESEERFKLINEAYTYLLKCDES